MKSNLLPLAIIAALSGCSTLPKPKPHLLPPTPVSEDVTIEVDGVTYPGKFNYDKEFDTNGGKLERGHNYLVEVNGKTYDCRSSHSSSCAAVVREALKQQANVLQTTQTTPITPTKPAKPIVTKDSAGSAEAEKIFWDDQQGGDGGIGGGGQTNGNTDGDNLL